MELMADLTILEDTQSRNRYWDMLGRARKDYYKDNPEVDTLFRSYMIDTYGLEVMYRDGFIIDEHKIVDEKKYLMFLLKYGS